jgi:predicted small metal-binding protein
MANEEYKQMSCSDTGIACGFQVRAKTDDEIMEYARMHATKAHGTKEIWPETETKIKAAIKTVSVYVPESVSTENIHTTRQDFKFK